MIIHDFNIRRAVIMPTKTNPELVVDADAPLPFPVAAQGFEAVSWNRYYRAT
jgi:hypothetical protein